MNFLKRFFTRGINVRLLRKVKRHILEEPRRLLMYTWASNSNDAPCGTAGCIAGWSAILSGRPADEVKAVQDHAASIVFRGEAAQLLRISDAQAARLFYAGNWPNPFRMDYVYNFDRIKRAQITADRIEHFIATEGRE